MVTIEQKLTLFSKLLNQNLKEVAQKEMKELDKRYEKIIAESRFKIDQEASEMVERAKRQAEAKRMELLSKGRLSIKKENMQLRQQFINRFMESLEGRIKAYVVTPGYKVYLKTLIKQFEPNLKGYAYPLVIYLTPNDYKFHQVFIKEALVEIGLNETLLTFKVGTAQLLGGLLLEDVQRNMRMDETLRAVVEENKSYIIECITRAMGEGGEGDV